MEQVLLVVHVIIATGLIGLVLLQRSESDGFGLGSGSNANLMSGRSAANLMTRATAIMAAIFIINSLVLSILASHHKPASIVDAIKAQQEGEATPISGAPAVPLANEGSKKVAAPEVTTDKKSELPAGEVAKKPVKKVAKPTVPTDSESPSENTDSQ
ncbi:MAG: preprotein translocase subunit SecG [Rickettsiales bacterium]